MNIFDKFFKKSLDASEPKNKHYIYSSNSKLTLDEAQQFWKKMAQKLVVGVMNSVDYTAERTFILISFNEKDPTIDIFFQMNGQLRMWNDLDNEAHKKVISDNIVAQAPNIVKQVNCIYSNVDMTRLAYAQIQYEFESKAWYLHDITEDSIESQLEKDPAFLKWFDDVSKSIDSLSLDGKHRITWGPFKPEY